MNSFSQDEFRGIVELATRAPSVHNTQPWRFALVGGAIELRPDYSRRLPVMDPDGRLLTISCGAALLCARLGVRRLGREPVVTLLPDAADADLFAVLADGGAAPLTVGESALIRVVEAP